MSLVDVKGANFIPGFVTRLATFPSLQRAYLDADGELCGCVFEIQRTGNISKIGIRTWNVIQPDTLKISLQTVDSTTGRPTGTLIHADAYGTQTVSAFNVCYWVSLINPVAVSKNDILAIVVEFDNFASGYVQMFYAFSGIINSSFPYCFTFLGGSWSLYDYVPNFGLKYDDNIIEYNNILLPAVASAHIGWNTNINPDRRGLRFSVPYNCRISGVIIPLDLDADADIEIYDNDGTTLLETISLNKNLRGSIKSRPLHRNLITPIELTKDTFYRVVVHPTTDANMGIETLNLTDDGASEAMNALDGGVNFHYTTCHGSPSAEGDWTQTPTNRPLIGFMIDQLDDGVAACDYPAITDVEKGVIYGDSGYTGTFKEPGVANVKLGEQYGAGDTEFTGTYARNTVSGSTIVGQSTVGSVVGE